jgi:hypothetical protein
MNSYWITSITLKVVHGAAFTISGSDINLRPFVNALSFDIAEPVAILNALPTICLHQLFGFELSLS